MSVLDFFAARAIDGSAAQKAGFNPYYACVESIDGPWAVIGGQRYIDCASNDYLGLAADPRIARAMTQALGRYGASLCGTPIATGFARALRDLEQELAEFCGLADAVVFPSCFQANTALFGAIANKQDLVLVDHFAHASLVAGIRAAGCKIKPFLHNDTGHVARLLQDAKGFRQIFVVTESVFSTEGSIAPVGEIAALCQRYGAIAVVDDSHGIGVIGAGGRGILHAQAVDPGGVIYTASLGKAIANSGGMIAGAASLVRYLRYACPGLIYSTALTPANAAGVSAALAIIHQEFGQRSARLRSNRATLAAALHASGVRVIAGESPIVSALCGSDEATFAAAKRFFDCHVLVTAFVPPSVPHGEGRIRLIAGAKLDGERTREVCAAVERWEFAT